MAGLDKDQFDNRDFRKYDSKGNKQMWIIYFSFMAFTVCK